MANLFSLEIVTPERVEFNAAVQSVTCPGVQGRFQILHNHAPFLSSLGVGILKVIDEAGDTLVYAISGGVAQVYQNEMRVLADTAERSDRIDIERAQRARERAEQRLHERDEEIDHDRARLALMRAINRMKAVERG
jgi:F-type H+-transporting ATPase subunit epsilon